VSWLLPFVSARHIDLQHQVSSTFVQAQNFIVFASPASSFVSRAFEEKESSTSSNYSQCQQLQHQSTLHILDSFRIIELVASSSTLLCPKTQISIVLSSESQLAIGNQRDTQSSSSRQPRVYASRTPGQISPSNSPSKIIRQPSHQTVFSSANSATVYTSPPDHRPEEKGGKERMKKRGDQTFLFSLFFPRARFTRKAYLHVLWGEPNKNLLFTAPLHTGTRRKGVGLTHNFVFE
jgi:hypothetical protein